MKEIPLTRGYVALVDDCDADLASLPWCADIHKGGSPVYAQGRGDDGKCVRLHRIIGKRMGLTGKVDHKNRNGIDCRRDNLRSADHGENQCNVGVKKNNKSGYSGITFLRDCPGKPWRANVQRTVEGKLNYWYATFATLEEAIEARDAKRLELHGEFAVLSAGTSKTPC